MLLQSDISMYHCLKCPKILQFIKKRTESKTILSLSISFPLVKISNLCKLTETKIPGFE